MATRSLREIPTIAYDYEHNYLEPSSQTHSRATSRFNIKISLIRFDITRLEVDAIVNAANESLLGGGGVDGAIHRAAGPQLLRECETLGGCYTGSAKITDAYRLPCKKVIHAVGPVYGFAKREGMHEVLLQGCYTTSLDLAVQNGCRSIAFSALSTGVYGYPSREAAVGAITAVKGWLEEDAGRAEKMDRVVFCSFMEKDEKAYEEFIPKFFPPETASETEQGRTAHGKAESSAAARSEGKQRSTEHDHKQLPNLPDVPTQEPAAPGQPEAKKAKYDHYGGK